MSILSSDSASTGTTTYCMGVWVWVADACACGPSFSLHVVDSAGQCMLIRSSVCWSGCMELANSRQQAAMCKQYVVHVCCSRCK